MDHVIVLLCSNMIRVFEGSFLHSEKNADWKSTTIFVVRTYENFSCCMTASFRTLLAGVVPCVIEQLVDQKINSNDDKAQIDHT